MKSIARVAVLLALVSGSVVSAGLGTAEPGAAAAAEDTLESLLGDVKKPALWIGSKAPALSVTEFVKGESIEAFKPGHIYVMEFWATWCGPCIAAMPHVTELQKKYEGKVTVIGANVWEREAGAERSQKVRKFVEKNAERIGYTIAIDGEDALAETWMTAAGQQGIPASFLVDGQGRVAWIGHPMEMDAPLAELVAGTYDIEAWGKKAWDGQLAMAAFMRIGEGLRTEPEMAYRLIRVVSRDQFAKEPQALNALAWEILTGEGIEQRDTKLARELAFKSAELTEWNEFSVLDTYARACHETGEHAEAVKWQSKAIELAPEEAKEDLAAALETYRAAAEGVTKGG
jgi:thiol-disulfide isomerase/thioredoxin